MKKSSFWTFVFSLFPGAGHMYLGLMKKGASLMLLFCFVFALSGFFNLTFLMMFLPVIWFYSFFDAMNLRHIPYEDRLAQEDHFLFDMGGLQKGLAAGPKKAPFAGGNHLYFSWRVDSFPECHGALSVLDFRCHALALSPDKQSADYPGSHCNHCAGRVSGDRWEKEVHPSRTGLCGIWR